MVRIERCAALATPTPPTVATSAYDAVIQQNYGGGWGVELAVYKNGTPLYVHGYGLRDRGLPDTFAFADMWKVSQPEAQFNLARGQFAPDANTVFDLASVSKEFTAGAILLLQQDGKLSVNDPMSKYFPAFPNGNAITLLAHADVRAESLPAAVRHRCGRLVRQLAQRSSLHLARRRDRRLSNHERNVPERRYRHHRADERRPQRLRAVQRHPATVPARPRGDFHPIRSAPRSVTSPPHERERAACWVPEARCAAERPRTSNH
ncbi:MAG TPA: serine hydrolase [Candidatus Elarobacter sp.]|nr:serine hydrolase [Candidatus Elarobacter sp.]